MFYFCWCTTCMLFSLMKWYLIKKYIIWYSAKLIIIARKFYKVSKNRYYTTLFSYTLLFSLLTDKWEKVESHAWLASWLIHRMKQRIRNREHKILNPPKKKAIRNDWWIWRYSSLYRHHYVVKLPGIFYIKAFTLGNATRCLNFLGLAKSLDSAYFLWNL